MGDHVKEALYSTRLSGLVQVMSRYMYRAHVIYWVSPSLTFGSSGSHCTKWADDKHKSSRARASARTWPTPLHTPTIKRPCVKSCLMGGRGKYGLEERYLCLSQQPAAKVESVPLTPTSGRRGIQLIKDADPAQPMSASNQSPLWSLICRNLFSSVSFFYLLFGFPSFKFPSGILNVIPNPSGGLKFFSFLFYSFCLSSHLWIPFWNSEWNTKSFKWTSFYSASLKLRSKKMQPNSKASCFQLTTVDFGG